MSSSLVDHLAKLYKIANGALRNEKREGTRATTWWQGYRQALDDISQFMVDNAQSDQEPWLGKASAVRDDS